MKTKKLKKYVSLMILLGSLASCGSKPSSTSTYIAESLQEAIQNTSDEYQMDIETGMGYSYTYQIISPELYYYAPGVENYILLPEDPNYYHSFERTYLEVEETYRFGMDVHGRAGRKEDKDLIYSVNFLDILKKYTDDFSKKDEKTYMCTVKDLAYDLKDYFQNRAFTYCNYFELELGTDGRLASFRSYEKSLEETYSVGEVSFHHFDIASFEAYNLWNKEGRMINLRLVDLKIGSQVGEEYHLFYEGETVEVEGVVASYDFNNNLIIATESDVTGYIGLQVTLKNKDTLPKISERIKVTGKVTQERFTGRLIDASYTSIGKEEYYPLFDEERIVDSYGGGYYAAYIFSQTPVYADSVYSTYAYVESLPDTVEENQRAIINLICPSFESEENLVYHMQLILPSTMPLKEKQEALNQLKQFGLYNAENNEAEEVSLEHMILRFNPYYTFRVQLEYGSESIISKHLTPSEKVEKQFSLKGFPFPNTESFSCFSFGGVSGLSIEQNYGKEGKTQGIYYNASSLSTDLIGTEIQNMKSFGFELYNEINDNYHRRHQIYKMGDVYVDILLEEVSFSEGEKSLHMWIYQGEMIYKVKVQEKITENIPYFDVNDFITLDHVKDADMAYYQLPSYAGNVFTNSYLNCITLDVSEDCFASLRSSYINDKGFKSARDDSNKVYTYNTRGSNHYVLYKEIEGSNEKIFLDMAMYASSDYTFTGHDEFTNRIEILIYKATEPMTTKYENNLDAFSHYLESLNPGGSFKVNFTVSDTRVESWPAADDNVKYDYLYYGYYYEFDVFVYSSNLTQTYMDIVNGLVESGYFLSGTSSKGNETYAKPSSNGYGSYVFIMKETQKGYIRLIDGVGGIDF